MPDSRIPLYLITGFLDSGKTTLLSDTLNMDYFNDGQRTVLLMCEDGEEAYDQQFLSQRNCRLIPIEDQEQLNTEFLKEMYLNNMQSMFIDMVTEADMVLFNRCAPDMPLSGWKRSVRAVNRMCEIVFEDVNGEELEVEDVLPYSLEQPHITLEDPDYGIWYLDIQEHPDRYVGKTITYKAQAMTGMKLPRGAFVPGRNAMTCCVEDIRFFGFLCKYGKARALRKGEWITITAEIRWEHADVYEDEGVVLYAQSVEKAEPPDDPLVYFR